MEIPAPVQQLWHNKTTQIIVRPFMLIFEWRGRATRREVVSAFLMLPMLLLPDMILRKGDIDGLTMMNVLLWLLIFIGTAVRRMHDIRRHGWALCIAFFPYVGIIAVTIMLLLNPDNDGNPFGPDPRDYFNA